MVKRKSYKNPTIVEAVIEVRFAGPIDNAKIHKVLAEKYDCKKEDLLSFTAALNQESMSLSQNKTGQFRLRFTINEHAIAFVFPDRVSFHWKEKYPGWEVFQPAFKRFWEELNKICSESVCRRVGVRFINMVNEKKNNEKVGNWLRHSADYPKSLLSSQNDYFYSLKRPISKTDRVQLFVAEGELKANKFKPLILDIDVQQDIQNRVISYKYLLELLEKLHEGAVGVFEKSVSKNYKDLLNGRK
jgi:uncharacterized protein (TIGR04255 family)